MRISQLFQQWSELLNRKPHENVTLLTLCQRRPRCCGGGDPYRLVRYAVVSVNDCRFQTQSGPRFAGVWSEVLDLQSQSVKIVDQLASGNEQRASALLQRPLAPIQFGTAVRPLDSPDTLSRSCLPLQAGYQDLFVPCRLHRRPPVQTLSL